MIKALIILFFPIFLFGQSQNGYKNQKVCTQIWAEDSGATSAVNGGTFDYSFGNGNELSTAANQNWGALALYDGEIIAYGMSIDDPVTQIQTVELTLDESNQVPLTVGVGQSEALQTGLSIPVTQGQVINWRTTAGNADDVIPTIIICYDIQ